MAKIKKAQVGAKAKASKDSVPSEMNPGKMIPKTAVRKGSYITVDKPAPKKKMKEGGSLKAVPADKEKSLGKLPTSVRNKMGFQKNGGKASKKKMQYGGAAASMVPPMKSGGNIKKARSGCMSCGGKMK